MPRDVSQFRKLVDRALQGIDTGNADPILVQACVEYGVSTTIATLARARETSLEALDALVDDLTRDLNAKVQAIKIIEGMQREGLDPADVEIKPVTH